MANIVFFVSILQLEFNSSLKLAKTLKLLGHKVFHLSYLDSEEKVCKHGFLFLPILGKWFNKGFFQQQDDNYLNLSGLRLLLDKKREIKLYNYLISSLNQKVFQRFYQAFIWDGEYNPLKSS
ncbi:MAG: hypothetical protein V7K18_21620 [Nostoc sp.]|uniref:hypothetical protein n=1 Tax=Nostoc sp. TaxID=1180 RepID=UPI002FF93EB9